MQWGTAPLAPHEADFENLANVYWNLHPNELYATAGLSARTRKCTQNVSKSSQVVQSRLLCALYFILCAATLRHDIAKSAFSSLCHSTVVSVTDRNSSIPARKKTELQHRALPFEGV